MALWFTGELLASTERRRKEKIGKWSSLRTVCYLLLGTLKQAEVSGIKFLSVLEIDGWSLFSIEDVQVFPGQITVFNSLSFGDFNLF